MNRNKLLVVDDDLEILNLLGEFLSKYGFITKMAANGVEMFNLLNNFSPDLIILDLMIPGDDGLVLCKKIRLKSNVPIIMLTAIGSETDRIIGLEIGADDYLPKPFSPRELLARIKAILRRSNNENSTNQTNTTTTSAKKLGFAEWSLDKSTRTLYSPDEMEISLTAGEYDLLCAFLDNPQNILSRDKLLDITKNREAGPFDRSIDVQISRLRHKIEPDHKNPSIIKTVRGGGYLFTPDVITL